MMKIVEYGGWKNCVRLENAEMELVVTTDVGPRVIRLGFKGSQNFFREMEDQSGRTGGDTWKIYGGHRLWHAPEFPGRTDAPDNGPVSHAWDGRTLKLVQPVEKATGIRKEIEISLDPDRNRVGLLHRLVNQNLWEVTLSVWALSVMNKSSRAVIPQEPYAPHGPDHLLPVRPVALWSYTNMADPRWTWGSRSIQLRQDPTAASAVKAGVLNRQGWAACALGSETFIKTYPCNASAVYPDYGTNTQFFTNADILEIETLGPLTAIPPGGSAEHREDWSLHKTALPTDEDGIVRMLAPLLKGR